MRPFSSGSRTFLFGVEASFVVRTTANARARLPSASATSGNAPGPSRTRKSYRSPMPMRNVSTVTGRHGKPSVWVMAMR